MADIRRPATVVLASFALLVCLACGGGGGSADPTTATPPTPTPVPDPRAIAEAGAKQLEAAKSFHFLLEHENGSSPIALGLNMKRAEGDLLKPDRLKADVDAETSGLGKANVKVKVVAVGTKAMVTNPFLSRQWLPLPGDNPIADLFDPAAGTSAVLRNAQNLRIAGEETIDGKAVWRIEGEVDGAELRTFTRVAQAGYTAKGIAWVGKDVPYVYRIRLEGPVGPDDPRNIVRKVELSKFDEPVTIELP